MAILANLYQLMLARMSEEEGQGMVEYALILVLVSIVAIVMLGNIGGAVNTVFTQINTALRGG